MKEQRNSFSERLSSHLHRRLAHKRQPSVNTTDRFHEFQKLRRDNLARLDQMIDEIAIPCLAEFKRALEDAGLETSIWVKKSSIGGEGEPVINVALRTALAVRNIVPPKIDFRFSPDFADIRIGYNYRPRAVTNLDVFAESGWDDMQSWAVDDIDRERFEAILMQFVDKLAL